jgi:hypothetical protein
MTRGIGGSPISLGKDQPLVDAVSPTVLLKLREKIFEPFAHRFE